MNYTTLPPYPEWVNSNSKDILEKTLTVLLKYEADVQQAQRRMG